MTRPIVLLMLAGALHGCASAGKSAVESMPPPASPQEARQQMDQLEQMIRDNRVALGLPAPEEGTIATTGGAAEPAEPAAPQALTPSPGPPPPAAPPSPASADAADEAPLAMESRGREEVRRRRHCAPGCRYTKAICQAAGRICSLARYLGGDDASRRCQRAERDCRDARRATANRDCDDCDD